MAAPILARARSTRSARLNQKMPSVLKPPIGGTARVLPDLPHHSAPRCRSASPRGRPRPVRRDWSAGGPAGRWPRSSAQAVPCRGTTTSCWSWRAIWPGRPGALLRPAPLGTGHASFPAPRLGQAPRAWWRAEVAGLCGPGGAPGAVSVQETESALVRVVARLLGDGITGYRLAGGRQPLFPLARGLRRPVGVQEELPAPWAPAVLCLQEPQGGRVDGAGYSPVPPGSPVLGQGWVVG
jgi:hypothetical protein